MSSSITEVISRDNEVAERTPLRSLNDRSQLGLTGPGDDEHIYKVLYHDNCGNNIVVNVSGLRNGVDIFTGDT